MPSSSPLQISPSYKSSFPSLDVRKKVSDEKRSVTTLVTLLTSYSRQGPGGQLDPSFISSPFCVLCNNGAVCLGPNCLGRKRPRSSWSAVDLSVSSATSPPGLAFSSSSNAPIKTPRNKRIQKIKCFSPNSEIFNFQGKKVASSSASYAKASSGSDVVETIPTRKHAQTESSIMKDDKKWLQMFLRTCGRKTKPRRKSSPSSSGMSSLQRKLLVSELPCARKSDSSNTSLFSRTSKTIPSISSQSDPVMLLETSSLR